jgi:hypothetical protein
MLFQSRSLATAVSLTPQFLLLHRGVKFLRVIFLSTIWMLQFTWIKLFSSKTKTKLRGLSPQANYADRATAACRGSQCQLFADRGCRVVSATDPHSRILGFQDRSQYCFFQVVSQLYSRGWVDPVPDPLFLSKSGSAGKRTRVLWICSQELLPLDHRGGLLFSSNNL